MFFDFILSVLSSTDMARTTVDIDADETENQETTSTAHNMKIPPLLVRGTGPVDAANYPIFEFQSENKQIDSSFAPKTLSERDLDCLDNENPYLPKNDKNARNGINREFALGERGFLKPGICTKSPDDVLHIYGLVDSVRPYHLKQAQEAQQKWIWISGSIVANKEEAEYPSIDEDDPLHSMHEVGYFEKYETVQFTEKNGGNILSESGTGQIIRGYEPFIDDSDLYPYPWNIDGRGQLQEGQYLVRIGDEFDARVIDTKLYDIQRINAPTPSPLKNLFHIKVTPESSFMAWKLRDILVDIGIAHDWLTVTIIAEYLPFCYQRDIYFDSKRFEEIIHERDGYNDNEIATESVRNACRRSMNYPWPDDEGYYQSKILEIGQYEISTAAPHPLLSQNPRLPQITLSGRAHIGLVAKRLDTALKPSTNLYGYQLHTVLWCHELERSILAKQTLCIGSNDLRFCSGSNCAVYVNPDNTYSAARKSRSIEPRIVKYGGGVISDDVGLGKTLTMLSLMAVHPPKDVDHNSSTTNSVTKELGPNGDTLRCDATLVVAPSHLIHQWKDEIDRHFHEDTFTVITITVQKEFQKISYRDVLDADIVLISAAFLKSALLYDRNRRYALNWRMEREDTNTKKDAAETKGTEQPRRRSTRIKKNKELQKMKVEQQREQQYQNLAKKAPFLDLFHWRRFILDEGHELLLDKPLRENIFALSSDFKWYCTATPFPQKQLSMDYAAEFLDIRLNGKFVEWTNQKGSISVLHNVIHHHLYSKHTKESILADNHLPDIQETCKLIEFHPIERVLYDTTLLLRGTEYGNRELERAICSGALDKLECGLYKSWRRKLLNFGEDVRTFFVSNGRYKGRPFADIFPWAGPGLLSLQVSRQLASEMRKYKLKLKEPILESQLDEYGRKTRQPIELSVREFLKLNQENCDLILGKMRGFRMDIEYLKNQRVPELKQYKKEFDEMKQRFRQERRTWDVDVAWPNHLERKKYTECHAKLSKVEKWLAMWEEGMETWPLIQKRLHQNITRDIKQFEKDITASPRGQVLLDIMRKYGSKQALLLQFIQQILEDPNSRIIIFSLFGELLRILKNRLKMIKVEAGLCRGNVIARKKAMRAFQQEITTKTKKQRVILLSSKDAASGADLEVDKKLTSDLEGNES